MCYLAVVQKHLKSMKIIKVFIAIVPLLSYLCKILLRVIAERVEGLVFI